MRESDAGSRRDRAFSRHTLALASGTLLALAVYSAAIAQQSRPSPPLKSPIERGKYVAEAADCMSCHTSPGGQPFAGGGALKTAFGTIYGTNITPDSDTGIGGWTKGVMFVP